MQVRSDGPLNTIDTMFEIIETIKQEGGLGVSEVAEQLDIPNSTASDHLVTLRKNGYLVKGGREYRPGLRFLELGDHARNFHDIYRTAKPKLDLLARETGELVHLSVEEEGWGVVIYETEGEQAVSLDTYVGRRVPMHCTALGQAMLAYMPDEYAREIIDRTGLPEITARTITDEEHLFERLETVSDRGYAVSRGARIPELGCIATPIRKYDTVRGAVSICCPISRADNERFEEELPQRVIETANRINLDLKYD